MWWCCLMMLAWAGPRSDARAALDAGRLEEAAGLARVELLSHPQRGWAVRVLTHATEAMAEEHLARGRQLLWDGRVEAGREAFATARRILARGQASGALVEAERADGERQHFEEVAGQGLLEQGRAARTAGRFEEADRVLRASRQLGTEGAHDELAGLYRDWSAWLQARGELAAAARRREEGAVLSGLASDREAAAALLAELARRWRSQGDCRRAAELLRGAAHLHDAHEAALGDATACAMVDVVVAVRVEGMNDGAQQVATRVQEALTARGSRYLRVATAARARPHTVSTPQGPVERPAPWLVLSAEVVADDVGESTKRVHRRPGRGGTTTVHHSYEAPVTVAWEGELLVRQGTEVLDRRPVRAEATTTARWVSRAQAHELGATRLEVKGKPLRQRGPALAEARDASTAAVVRQVAAEITEAAMTVVEPALAVTPPSASGPPATEPGQRQGEPAPPR
jgi:tetratricopeptide (TPR) repeat protein